MKMLAVRNFFAIGLITFSSDLANSVYFHLSFHCHYFPYLVLVFMFKFNCNSGNRYFWRCMLKHTKRQVHKWKFYNISCLVMFITGVCLLFLIKFFLSCKLGPDGVFVGIKTQNIHKILQVPVSFLFNSNLTIFIFTGSNTCWSYLKHVQCPHYTRSPY